MANHGSSGATRVSIDYVPFPESPLKNSPCETKSVGNCASLFDDNDTLSRMCLDLEVADLPTDNKRNAWCTSSNYSCCSLCRLPEDLDDDVALRAPAAGKSDSANGVASGQPVFSQIGDSYLCNCNIFSPGNICCGSCDDGFSLPFNFISIPSGCVNSSISGEPSKIPRKGKVFLPNRRNLLTTGFVPDDVLIHILTFLDVASLARARECNSKLLAVASNDNAGWKMHCTSLWLQKVHVSPEARALLDTSNLPRHVQADDQVDSSTAMKAYKASVTDAKSRHEVKFEELCFDDNANKIGTMWSFRFKESAGLDWTSWDPWWSGKAARKLVFLRDGTMLQAHPHGRTVVKTHNGVPLYDVFSERVVQRNGVEIIPPRIEMSWRFVVRPLDFPERADGAYIRITVGGRDVPTYIVRRSSNGNWGFVMESCWGVYSSFELAPQVSAARSRRRRLRRTRNGSRWVNVDDSESEGANEEDIERERERNVRQRINLFVEESAMSVTGYSQWREAFLYNIGAVALPEGDNATDAFENAWNSLMRR